MQPLTETKPQSQELRKSILLDVAASFVTSNGVSPWVALCVPSIRVLVCYSDGQPVTGLNSENFIIVNAENASDLTH